MAASVQVLCPNGRRQNVKVNSNTKLLQILEEVCQRQGFIPPEDYKLVQGRKEFDLSLSVRFASIPNNAKLELVKSESSRKEQEVTIALQLASGQRHQADFHPSSSLWDILLLQESKFSELKGLLTRIDSSQTPCLHPVCIYMREEVVGEQALRATTLRKLGLTSGKAIIRHVHRPVEASVLGEIVDQVEKEKQKQAKLEEIAVKKKDELDERQREEERKTKSYEMASISEGHIEDEPMEVELEERRSQTVVQPASQLDSEPEVEARRQVLDKAESSVSSTTSSEQASAIQELIDLNIPGVQVFTPDDFSDLSPQEQAIALRLAARFLPHLQAQQNSDTAQSDDRAAHSGAQQQQEQETSPQSFQNFKFPEQTKGKDLQGDKRLESVATTACDREAVLYDSSELLMQSSLKDSDVPDDFFEVTQNDVKLMYRDLQNAVQRMEEQPLMTATMRQDRAESMFDAYSRIVVRVQFPDRSVLQGLFRPREKVSALQSFVKENLDNKEDKFYLYTSPPKEILQDINASLAVSKLAPASVVYYGSEIQRESYVSEELRNNIKPRMEAEKIVRRILHPETQSEAGPSGVSSQLQSSPDPSRFGSHRMSAGVPSASTSSGRAGGHGSQAPKWFKLGKK